MIFLHYLKMLFGETLRYSFQFYDQSQTSAELADLLERISPYFLNGVQVFGVIVGEAVVFLALIALVYRRQEI